MPPTLYMVDFSMPVRAVLMTAKAIGLTLNRVEVNTIQGDQFKPEFLKLNPQHTVPTLVDDDGFTLWDSHAIITYLVSKYAKDDSLYPKDVKKRALIDQRLYFESGVVFATLKDVLVPLFRDGRSTIEDRDRARLEEINVFMEAFLDGRQWAAGEFLSVADYSLISSISSLDSFFPVDPQKFPKVVGWMKRVGALSEYETNEKGLKELEVMIKSKLE